MARGKDMFVGQLETREPARVDCDAMRMRCVQRVLRDAATQRWELERVLCRGANAQARRWRRRQEQLAREAEADRRVAGKTRQNGISPPTRHSRRLFRRRRTRRLCDGSVRYSIQFVGPATAFSVQLRKSRPNCVATPRGVVAKRLLCHHSLLPPPPLPLVPPVPLRLLEVSLPCVCVCPPLVPRRATRSPTPLLFLLLPPKG